MTTKEYEDKGRTKLVEDFKNSEVKAITPDDFINLWTNLCKL